MQQTTAVSRSSFASSRKRELLEALLRKQARPPVTAIPRRTSGVRVPLSFAQQRLWFLDKLDPAKAVYNVPAAIRLEGALRVDTLEASFNEIVRRHESLRTTFGEDDGEALQWVTAAAPVPLPTVDLSDVSGETREAEAIRLVREESERPFDLAHGPLVRAMLLRLAETDHVLMLTMHHIISDGWSVGVFLRELKSLYTAFAAGEPSPLPELPVQYGDFAVWQRGPEYGERLGRELSYWKKQLAGAPELLNLPLDRPRPALGTHRGGVHTMVVPEHLTAQVRKLSGRASVSLFMALLAAFQALLYRYSGQEDIVVGTSIANRNRAALEPLIGFFVNVLALRTRVNGAMTYRKLLEQVRDVALEAYTHQDISFERIVDALNLPRTLSHTPLFQVAFVVQNAPQERIELPGLTTRPFGSSPETVKFDLTLSVGEAGSTLKIHFEYSTDIFERSTIERMAGHYLRILESVVNDPEIRIADLQFLSDEELRQVVVDWNHTEADFDPAPVCELFEARAMRWPQATAAVFETQRVTYDELNRRANRLAHYLIERGAEIEKPVAIFMDRSLDLLVAILAVLKSGAPYLPIEIRNPPGRVRMILEDSQAALLLTDRQLETNGHGFETIVLPDRKHRIEAMPDHNPEVALTPQNLAYVIYTSGSTGRPKGALLHHAGFANLVHAVIRLFAINEKTRFLQFASIGFDASVIEIFATLVAGGRVCLARQETLASAEELTGLLQREEITTALLTPAMLGVLSDRLLPSLSCVCSGGEACSPDIARRWSVGRRFINAYGPTEVTVVASAHSIQEPSKVGLTVSIGRPIANTQIYLLDDDFQPVPAGIPGELHVASAGLARGYLGRPDLTAEKFIPNPFAAHTGERLYRTGDLARYLENGDIEFLGRIDQQVKLRGFRIELGEIEAVLQTQPDVQAAAVTVHEDTSGTRRLVAHIVPRRKEADIRLSIKTHLKERLPEYMMPSQFVIVESFPLTSSGKVDRKALPPPDAHALDTERCIIPARNAVESRLCEIWSELLGAAEIGVNDNFFELGGDSILGIQMVSRASASGIHLTVRHLFEHQTVAELAGIAGTAKSGGESGISNGPAPLTPIQEWFFEQDLAEPEFWNQAVLLEVDPKVAPDVLERSIHAVADHHEAFRTRFRKVHDRWVQEYAPDMRVSFTLVDLSRLADDERTGELERHMGHVQRELSITQGPLIRAVLYAMPVGQRARLLVVAHHLVIDNVSWRILLEDLEQSCRRPAGAPIALPSRTASFLAWARRLQAYAGSAELRQEADFWVRSLPLEVPSLPVDFDRDRTENTRASAAVVTVFLSERETRQLIYDVPRSHHAHINDVLLAALAATFRRWTGEQRLLVDLEGHGREPLFEDMNVSRTVGWFTSCYPLTLETPRTAEPDPARILESVSRRLQSTPNRGAGYGVLRYLAPDAAVRQNLRTRPHPEVSFNYLGQFDHLLDPSSLFSFAAEPVGPCQSPRGRRQHLIEIGAAVVRHRLKVELTFSRNFHRRGTILRVAEQYIEDLRRLVTHCVSRNSVRPATAQNRQSGLNDRQMKRLLASIGLADTDRSGERP